VWSGMLAGLLLFCEKGGILTMVGCCVAAYSTTVVLWGVGMEYGRCGTSQERMSKPRAGAVKGGHI
jgi:hypothetical protein